MVTENVPFGDYKSGDAHISADRLVSGTAVPFVVFGTPANFTLSAAEIAINGKSLSLAFQDGRYSLEVIRLSGGSAADSIVSMGDFLEVYDTGDSRALFVKIGVGNETIDSVINLNGFPLAKNSNNELIMVEVDGSSFDEEEELFWGGRPVNIRRIDGRWYLLVTL